jgi:hypothetical protein
MLAHMAGAEVFTAEVDSTEDLADFMVADFMVADFTPEGTDALRVSTMVLVTGTAATGTMAGVESAMDGGGVTGWDGLIIRTDRITLATTTPANPRKAGITVPTRRATTPT